MQKQMLWKAQVQPLGKRDGKGDATLSSTIGYMKKNCGHTSRKG